MKGKAYLIPAPLNENEEHPYLANHDIEKIKYIDTFLVEDPKIARKHLKRLDLDNKLQDLTLKNLNKHTTHRDYDYLIEELQVGKDVGIMSDAGAPAIADPGENFVLYLHKNNIEMVPIAGPSSIMLVLMVSGLNGNNFELIGYSEVGEDQRAEQLEMLSAEVHATGKSIVLFETPYRNFYLWKSMMENLHPQNKLCIAFAINQEKQYIRTATVDQWQNMKWPEFDKSTPAIFVIGK